MVVCKETVRHSTEDQISPTDIREEEGVGRAV